MSAAPPPPAQRKLKLLAALKNIQTEQSSKLQAKNQLEHDLLEDIRLYTKERAKAEKDYAQSLLKVTSQLLSKFNTKENEAILQEESRTPFATWRKLLQESEAMATSRMEISQKLQDSVADSIKTLKTERVTTLKKCSVLSEKQQQELQESVNELTKSQKHYVDIEKTALAAKDHVNDATDKLKKGSTGLFSSKAKLERNLSKASERLEGCEKRATIARNELLLQLAAMNAHQRKYYALDIPDLIAMQDGTIYEEMKSYFTTITSADVEAGEKLVNNLKNLQTVIQQLERAYAVDFFLKKNPVFTKCTPYEFHPLPGDQVNTFSQEFGAGLHLNKEARKWVTRHIRDQRMIKKKGNEIKKLQNDLVMIQAAKTGSLERNTTTDIVEGGKSPETVLDELQEEIRHLEVQKTKSEGRIEALKQAGVDTDQWIVEATNEVQQSEDEQNEQTSFHDDDEDEGEDVDDGTFDNEFDDEWDDSPTHKSTNFSDDDQLSVSSSLIDQNRLHASHAIVIYPYMAASTEELSIVDGEEVEVLESEGDGWLKSRNKAGDIGYIPETYVEMKPQRRATGLSVHSSGHSDDANSGAGSLVNSGSVPENPYAEVTPSALATARASICSENQSTLPKATGPPILCYVKAIYDYPGCTDEELSFMEGDIIAIVSKEDDEDGWWEGTLNGERGVFPNIVVEEINESEALDGDCYATYPFDNNNVAGSHPGEHTGSFSSSLPPPPDSF